MLAHRLADYYLLGHVVDTTMTGVKITRTPYCRMYVFFGRFIASVLISLQSTTCLANGGSR